METKFDPKAGDKVHVMLDNKPEEVFVTAKITHEKFEPGKAKADEPVVEYRIEKLNRLFKAGEVPMFKTKAELLASL